MPADDLQLNQVAPVAVWANPLPNLQRPVRTLGAAAPPSSGRSRMR